MASSAHRPSLLKSHISQLETVLIKKDCRACDVLFELLTKPELTFLSACSSLMRTVISDYTSSAWCIDLFLSAWFHYPVAFRASLARGGAVMTGSQIIRFFDRQGPARGRDLDVVTRVGGVPFIATFLEGEGYSRQPRKVSDTGEEYPVLTEAFGLTSSRDFKRAGGKSGIVAVMDFVKVLKKGKYKGNPLELKVQIIAVVQPPIEHIIFSFHSSGVMNYATHRMAVAVFPKHTFIDKVFYASSREPLGSDWNPGWVEKYSSRGFTIDTRDSAATVAGGNRSALDDMCWKITFQDHPKTQRMLDDVETSSIYPYSSAEDVKFDVIWMTEPVSHEGLRCYRMGILERDSWYYAWSLFSSW